MKLLLDQGLPRSAAGRLRDAGVDVLHAGDCGLGSASDKEILAVAEREERAVVTLDADFHALLTLGGASGPSVIRIRIEGLQADGLVHLVRTVLDRFGEDLGAGAMVSVTEGRIRVRHLPIGSRGDRSSARP